MTTKANDAPILLLQWLNTAEYKETQAALKALGTEAKIMYADVQSKAETISVIEQWLDGNPNAQFLFIGTHGNDYGIGPTVQNGVEWAELWSVLKKAAAPIALWLGACQSACAAKAWSPVKGYYAPVDYIVGFPGKIYPTEIEVVLLQLLEMTGIHPPTYVDQEMLKLREAVPNTTVSMHYKAPTIDGEIEYVDVDQFPQRLGMSFSDYLVRGPSAVGRKDFGG